MGSAYSSTFDENRAIRYFQAFVKPLAICSAYLQVRYRRLRADRENPPATATVVCCAHRGIVTAASASRLPFKDPGRTDDIGDRPEIAVGATRSQVTGPAATASGKPDEPDTGRPQKVLSRAFALGN
ncbi:hypothetical protein GCM10009836_05190 [Pseudonocardia ailaonensis]|uniref:Uncharacterized protein n=1 Tax=Pseudonocardia ailaonensis TaxID=367279 RepID=A0ABN2MK60_9PSEU